MPEKYRKFMIRQISQHAHSEYVGMLLGGELDHARADPAPREGRAAGQDPDEAGHAAYLYSAAETLGTSRDEMLADLHSGKAKYSSIFNYPTLTWGRHRHDRWLRTGKAIVNQVALCRTSYGPYARAMVRICKEELSPAPGLRDHHHAGAWRAGAEGDGAGCAEPLVVAGPDDVRPA